RVYLLCCFFQAEDGIRDRNVTGVQTCALPIFSTFLAGLFLLILVVGLGDLVAQIPMAALVAVMVMVSVGTFDWHSIHPNTLRRKIGRASCRERQQRDAGARACTHSRRGRAGRT